MAQKIDVSLIDDIDGTPAKTTVLFGFEGKDLVIDLSDANATKLRKVMAPYLGAARPAPRRGRTAASPRARRTTGELDPAAIRAWAAQSKIDIASRGRIPVAIVEQYRAAN